MEQKYIESTLGLIDFISDSPSCYHVVSNAKDILLDAGFTELDEKKEYKLSKGKNYFVTRNGSALIAFTLPSEEAEGFSIISSHTDSPCFKIKENPEKKTENLTTLNVEAYGGMLMAAWFDRPLSIAGRAFVRENSTIVRKNVDIDRDLCSIVNLCIHQNRDINKGHEYKVQSELMPLISQSSEEDFSLKALVAETLGCEEEDIIDTELFLYNREMGKIWGSDNQFFSSPKIDDLQCLWCSLNALLQSSNSKKIRMICLFDNEEVGSLTRQGADSDFMRTTISRLSEALGYSYQKQSAMLASSFMLSADNGHSLHPNYANLCDITNKPLLNGGVLIKYAGNQKYTTDGYSGAVLKNILDKANVPYQVFFNNSNVSGGSTLGNLAQAQVSLPAADIGAAQLAMHSPYETGGIKDTYYLTEGMKAFFEA